MNVANVGGTGAQTSLGILVVDVVGASNGSFTLKNPDTVVAGQNVKVAGAFGYALVKDANGNWYLRSELVPEPPEPSDPEPPVLPLFQPGAPVYEALPQALLALNTLPTLQQRVGNRHWRGAGAATHTRMERGFSPQKSANSHTQTEGALWGRVVGLHSRMEPESSTTLTSCRKANLWKLQAGIEGALADEDDGKLIAGLTRHLGESAMKIKTFYGDGRISTVGYGVGGTLTWYGDGGFYADAQGSVSWFDSDLHSSVADRLAKGVDGFGYVAGLEPGQRIDLDTEGADLTLTPQAQLYYSSVEFDAFRDPFEARISDRDGDSLIGRLGISLDHETSWVDDEGELRRNHLYGIVNLHYEFMDKTAVDLAGVRLAASNDDWTGEIGLGISHNFSDDRISIYGEADAGTGLSDFGDSYYLKGQAGIRFRL